MKKIMSNEDSKKLETVNNNVNGNLNGSKTMTNAEMMKMIEDLSNKVAELEKKKSTGKQSTDAQTFTISGKVKLSDVDDIIIDVGDKKKFLAPQAKHSLRAIIKLRDAASGTMTFTRKEWAEATEAEVDDWSNKYRQTGDRINQWYHHQNNDYVFEEMTVNGEPLFS